MVICTSPQLFAAYRVLRRLWEPRHPPYALICFQFFMVIDKSTTTWVSSNLLLWFFCRKYFHTLLPFCSCNFHHNSITYLYMTKSQLPLLIYYFQHVNELFRNFNDQLNYHNPFCYSGLPVSGLSVSFVNITGVEPGSSRCYHTPFGLNWRKAFLKNTIKYKIVEDIGVEPMTSCVQGRRSSQLS